MNQLSHNAIAPLLAALLLAACSTTPELKAPALPMPVGLQGSAATGAGGRRHRPGKWRSRPKRSRAASGGWRSTIPR